MKIPAGTATLPQWAMEIMSVAPEDRPRATDANTAAMQLRELRQFMQHPLVQYVLGQCAAAVLTTPVEIENAKLDGVHSIMEREQLIGEVRGLRRPIFELDEMIRDLTAVASGM